MAPTEKDITLAFEKALSRHGFGFQYAVLKEIKELYEAGKSYWYPTTAEFPVDVQGSGTRIDIILEHKLGQKYMVCECKRVDPALGNWCFARASRPTDIQFADRSYIEMLRFDGHDTFSELKDIIGSDRIFQIAAEVRSDQKGDSSSSGRNQIEDAATQVCRGFNGLMRFFATRTFPPFLALNQPIGFIPVIITTANILATKADISRTNLETGQIANLTPALEAQDWLWYEYTQSPNLVHKLPNYHGSKDLVKILFGEYVRRIAIVNPSGIGAFLGMEPWRF